MDQAVFTISGFDITWVELILCTAICVLAVFIYVRYRNFAFYDDEKSLRNRTVQAVFRFRLALSLLFSTLVLLLRFLHFDIVFFEVGGYAILVSHVTELLSLFFIALLLDWVISHMVIRKRFYKREHPVKKPADQEGSGEVNATRRVRYIVFLYVLQVILRRLDLDILLFQRDIKGELFTVHLTDLLVACIIILCAQVLVWFITQVTLYRMYRHNQMDEGIQFAINQIVSYIIYVIAIILALDRIVSDMSIIYGGAAALLVGVGLGLQQTFNDFFSGLLLLFERSVMVGDILEVEGQVGRVTKIGLRASRIETVKSVSMLIPNSKLVNQSVINWSHSDDVVRFELPLVAPYGTNSDKVRDILIQIAGKHAGILATPPPFVRLNTFSAAGLEFVLYFYVNQPMEGEEVKSELRFAIETAMREEAISLGAGWLDPSGNFHPAP